MFLTVHGAIGLIIGQNIGNPLLATILAFISHYIFDIIPHGDTRAPKKYHNPIFIGLAAIIDFIILLIFLLTISFKIDLLKINLLLPILAALLPDFAQAGYFFTNKKLFGNWQKIHNFLHNNIIADKFEWPLLVGLLMQITILIISLIIIL